MRHRKLKRILHSHLRLVLLMLPLFVWLLLLALMSWAVRVHSHLGWLGLYLAVAWLETRWVIDTTHRL